MNPNISVITYSIAMVENIQNVNTIKSIFIGNEEVHCNQHCVVHLVDLVRDLGP